MEKLLFSKKYVALDIEITKCQNNEMKPKAMSKKVRRIVSCGPLTYIECFQYHKCFKYFRLIIVDLSNIVRLNILVTTQALFK